MPRKHQNNNKGFSLIELLVAIAILAVVMIPMLHSFVTSARTNTRAGKVMEATTAAQNVFEQLKSEDLTTYLGDCTSEQVMDGSNPVLDIQGKPIYTYKREFSNLDVNGRKFHAKVTLDPQKYTSISTTSEANKKTDYNTLKFANLSTLSKASNAFYIQKADQEIKAAKDIDLGEYEEVEKKMSRNITLEVDYDESTKLARVYVTVTYQDGRDGKSGTVTPINHVEIYNNSESLTTGNPNVLSNIFLCFYPMYNSSSRISPRETIEIKNPKNYKVCVFLVKQTDRDTSSNPNYVTGSSSYSVKLSVDEGHRDTLAGADGKPDVLTTVATNLMWNDAANMSELQIAYLNNGGSAVSSIPTGYAVKDMLNLKTDLQRSDSETKIYDVTIEVYDEGDANAKVLTKIEGTKIQ